jgi:hypothetical protein
MAKTSGTAAVSLICLFVFDLLLSRELSSREKSRNLTQNEDKYDDFMIVNTNPLVNT